MPNNDVRREIRTLRLLLDINNRLRLEALAALSRVFRENGIAITDDLFATLTFAIPDELPGNSSIVSPVQDAEVVTTSTGKQPPSSTPEGSASQVGPQPPSSVGNQPPSSVGNQPPSSVGNQPPSSVGNQPPSSVGNQPPSSVGNQPPSSTGTR
jgi:hypothetical protein